jgi:hypothetical protein
MELIPAELERVVVQTPDHPCMEQRDSMGRRVFTSLLFDYILTGERLRLFYRIFLASIWLRRKRCWHGSVLACVGNLDRVGRFSRWLTAETISLEVHGWLLFNR